ncbi:phosphatidate cytidylyltransferase [Paracandidimonas soli]|uniref:Phosphatidate cytidylyltransferase n=1 Tax=Paracandidimonas soli TaxID=1917182 RepID=A0A4R3VDK4_9BURK|nr:phosphatidate cytidylyltransferase [Paracandidimonas soli]TCV01782.1 phosphatidate cytidylyltransferase [Paracandidimonas soli]
MLKQRVITAVILLIVIISALLAPRPEPLVAILIVVAACAAWEWLRLVSSGSGSVPLAGAAAMFLILCLLAFQWFSGSPAAWAMDLRAVLSDILIPLVVFGWIVGATFSVFRADTALRRQAWRIVPAYAAMLAIWTALVLLFQAHGWWLLLSLMMLVWLADIAAYFTGKAFGRHKLAPAVSPGKTWEGAAGGVLAATAWTLLSIRWEGSFGALLAERFPLAVVALAAVLLAALSIVGDLFESLLKRRAGVKDSSGLLPGHGGVFDRIDALLPVAPAAYLLIEMGR